MFDVIREFLLSPQISATVKRIYDEYLGPSSPNTVNIDDRAVKAIEARLSNPPLNIFNEACEQVCMHPCGAMHVHVHVTHYMYMYM